uniref:Uncharacterized protein n=1 Tax=Pararge aegeria TaxID=116150 RepID=S4NX58_9NEOP
MESEASTSCRYPKCNDSMVINSSSSQRLDKLLLESRYIDQELLDCEPRTTRNHTKPTPCVCEICRKYHELFHTNHEES